MVLVDESRLLLLVLPLLVLSLLVLRRRSRRDPEDDVVGVLGLVLLALPLLLLPLVSPFVLRRRPRRDPEDDDVGDFVDATIGPFAARLGKDFAASSGVTTEGLESSESFLLLSVDDVVDDELLVELLLDELLDELFDLELLLVLLVLPSRRRTPMFSFVGIWPRRRVRFFGL